MPVKYWSTKRRKYVEPWWSKWDIALTMLFALGCLTSALLYVWGGDERWAGTSGALGLAAICTSFALIRRLP